MRRQLAIDDQVEQTGMRVRGSDPNESRIGVDPHDRRHTVRALTAGIHKAVGVLEMQGSGFNVVDFHSFG